MLRLPTVLNYNTPVKVVATKVLERSACPDWKQFFLPQVLDTLAASQQQRRPAEMGLPQMPSAFYEPVIGNM